MQAVYPVSCSYRQCTHCAFKDVEYSENEDIHEAVLELYKTKPFEHLEILTPGSFFYGYPSKYLIGQTLVKLPLLKRVLVESRVEYINVSDVAKFSNPFLNADKIVEVAVGYESSDENIRNLILNKRFPEENLHYFFKVCKEIDVHAVVYIIIKPPFLTEEESIEDSVKSALYVLTLADEIGVTCRINLEPLFIAGKYLEYLYRTGKYFPIKYSSVIEVIKRIMEGINFSKGKLYVGISDENLSKQNLYSDEYSIEAKESILDFNANQNVEIFKC